MCEPFRLPNLLMGLLLALAAATSFAAEHKIEDILDMAKGQTRRRVMAQQSRSSQLAQTNMIKSAIYPQLQFTARYSQDNQSSVFPMPGTPLTRVKGSTFNWDLTLSQSISPSRLGLASEIAGKTEDMLDVKLEYEEDMYAVEVIRTYGETLLALQSQRVSRNSERVLKTVLEFTEIESQGGGRTRVDLIQSRAAYESMKAQAKLATVAYLTKLTQLKVLLGREDDADFHLAEAKDPQIAFLQASDKGSQNSRDVKLKEYEAEIGALRVDFEKSYHWPSFSAFAKVNGNAYDYPDVDPNGTSPADAFGSDRRNYSFGLAMDWALFTGWRISETHRKAAADARLASLQWEEMKRLEQARIQEATQQHEIRADLFQAAQAELNAEKLVFEQAEADYKSGQIRLTDLLEAEQSLRGKERALTEVWLSWLMASANLKLATGQRVIGGS